MVLKFKPPDIQEAMVLAKIVEAQVAGTVTKGSGFGKKIVIRALQIIRKPPTIFQTNFLSPS